MKKIFILIFSLLFSTHLFANDFKQFVVLGDSLSDNGNLLNLLKIVPVTPPYYKGRFSNGPCWADYVSDYYYHQYFIATQNYAYGGATAVLHNLKDDPFIAPTILEAETSQYLLKNLFVDQSKILFTVWIGANDYLYDKQPSLDKLTDDVVNATVKSITKLIKSGAIHFLVMNLPDLSRTPYARNEKIEERLHDLSIMHNEKLTTALNTIKSQYPNVKFTFVDIYSLFNDALSNPEKFNQMYGSHITDTSEPCWLGGWWGNGKTAQLQQELQQKLSKNTTIDTKLMANALIHSPSLYAAYSVGKAYAEGYTPCANADEHIFWDIIHPSAPVHEILGKIVIQALKDGGEG